MAAIQPIAAPGVNQFTLPLAFKFFQGCFTYWAYLLTSYL